jgi:dTMP kinase
MTANKKFITFEGIDFSGKSTQINILKNRLNNLGHDVLVVREPGGTKISELIRDILLDKQNLSMTSTCELLLYSAARNQLLNEKIIHELKKGNFVIADRYVDSTTAYQGFGRKLPLELISQLTQASTNGFLPALTIFLDLPVEKMIARKKKLLITSDRLESAGIDFFHRVREGYLKIADKDTNRVKIITADQDIDSIEKQIWELVSRKINFNK